MATPETVKDILLRGIEGVERRGIPRDHSITPEDELDWFLAQCNQFRREYEDAARAHAAFAHEESKLEAERPVLAEQIKKRLMEQNAGLAATNAEKMVKVDPEYLNHLTLQRDTVRIKDDHRTQMESAKMRVQMALYATKVIGGWNV